MRKPTVSAKTAEQQRNSKFGIEESMKTYQLSEDQEQELVIQWKELMVGRFPKLKYLHHCPNGGSRHPVEAMKLRRMGVVPGVSDLFLPVARNGFHGIWIEMKRKHGGRLSADQKDWIEGMREEGYKAVRADGAEEAIAILEEYLGI